ncbi:hypothetical protein I2I11_13835 [Pontibacter sp. 172403-2]|uniref:hypothetical protein n=1 Tax=Pontibacter rufus TaxID=2791028 RepID=UPI0018AFE48F|nr:hypothetical protein [Pontibacter sp. 172403-2]MBF9254381.1 hypothetical protein [Pontibacter sp. 172403-2]
MAGSKTELDINIEGLILMIIFTVGWTISSEIFFDHSDHNLSAYFFGAVIIFLIYKCVKLKIEKNYVSVPPLENGNKKGQWYAAVISLEVIAIFAILIILINAGNEHLIIYSIALIVGLHFLPMAKIFNRKFDHYISFWTTAISGIGLLLILFEQFDYKIVNAFVCVGCAISTTTYGFKMIKDSNLIIEKNKK